MTPTNIFDIYHTVREDLDEDSTSVDAKNSVGGATVATTIKKLSPLIWSYSTSSHQQSPIEYIMGRWISWLQKPFLINVFCKNLHMLAAQIINLISIKNKEDTEKVSIPVKIRNILCYLPWWLHCIRNCWNVYHFARCIQTHCTTEETLD